MRTADKEPLYWSQTRIYSPALQEWLSADPLVRWGPQALEKRPGNWSSVRYAAGRPLDWVDESGRIVVKVGAQSEITAGYVSSSGFTGGAVGYSHKSGLTHGISSSGSIGARVGLSGGAGIKLSVSTGDAVKTGTSTENTAAVTFGLGEKVTVELTESTNDLTGEMDFEFSISVEAGGGFSFGRSIGKEVQVNTGDLKDQISNFSQSLEKNGNQEGNK